LEVPISFVQAALGDEIKIESLDGEVSLNLNPGAQSGSIQRIEDKGFPEIQGGTRGDLLIKIRLITPKKLTKKEHQLFEELKKEKGEASQAKEGGFFSRLFS